MLLMRGIFTPRPLSSSVCYLGLQPRNTQPIIFPLKMISIMLIKDNTAILTMMLLNGCLLHFLFLLLKVWHTSDTSAWTAGLYSDDYSDDAGNDEIDDGDNDEIWI